MPLRPILRWPDPRLSRTCAPVVAITPDLRQLALDMLDTMYDAPGRGLAAPQVGAMLRLFVMDVGWKDGAPTPRICVNPRIVAASEATATGPEGCLSIPGILADITRPAEVTLRWTSLEGGEQEARLMGFEAACAQHELDHLDGIVTFDRLGPPERARLEKAYAG